MTLIETIKQNQLTARKNHQSEVTTLLTTLIGEADMIGKNAGNRAPTDEEVVAVVKKFIKNIDETLTVINQTSDVFGVYLRERTILSAYLPKQLSRTDLNAICGTIGVEVGRSKGDIMKAFKSRYNGCYDGKVLAEVVDEYLKG